VGEGGGCVVGGERGGGGGSGCHLRKMQVRGSAARPAAGRTATCDNTWQPSRAPAAAGAGGRLRLRHRLRQRQQLRLPPPVAHLYGRDDGHLLQLRQVVLHAAGVGWEHILQCRLQLQRRDVLREPAGRARGPGEGRGASEAARWLWWPPGWPTGRLVVARAGACSRPGSEGGGVGGLSELGRGAFSLGGGRGRVRWCQGGAA
jgi:hypothetical protein